jgi:hypothetical protein
MQAFTPISAYDLVAVEDLYDIIEEIFGEDRKGETGRVVGDKSYRNIVGLRRLGRKKPVHMLIYFCERNGVVITNSWFKKPKRRSCTWKATGDGIRHQLVYLHVKHQFRYGIKQDVQTLPTAVVDSDHNLLVCKDVL